jgi:hypothetical protein
MTPSPICSHGCATSETASERTKLPLPWLGEIVRLLDASDTGSEPTQRLTPLLSMRNHASLGERRNTVTVRFSKCVDSSFARSPTSEIGGVGRRPVCPSQLWITVYGLGSGGSGSTGSQGSSAACSYFFAKFMWYSRTAAGTKGTCK